MELPQYAKDRIVELQRIVDKPFCHCCDYDMWKKDIAEAQKEIDTIMKCKEFIYEEEALNEELWK